MGWGWSDVNICIKSDKLAQLLKKHGITPKGAGTTKKGIVYDVAFEWEYESRYEYMAYEIQSAADLLYYYIHCVLAVENGKELPALESEFIQDSRAIADNVECASYDASVHSDINPKWEYFHFDLPPEIKKVKPGQKIFDDPKTAAPSWNRHISWIGENAGDKDVVDLLRERGWGNCYFFSYKHRSLDEEYGFKQRYIVVSDSVAAEADAGKLSRDLQYAMELRKTLPVLIVREADFWALGNFVDPVCEHKITSLEGKNVAVLIESSQPNYNPTKKTVKERGGITTSKLKKDSDYVIMPGGAYCVAPEEVFLAEKRYWQTGKPIIIGERQYVEQLSDIPKVAAPAKKPEVDPSLPITPFTGKKFVVNGFTPAGAKKLKTAITAVGGIVRSGVARSTDYVVYPSAVDRDPAGVCTAKEFNAAGATISIINEKELEALLAQYR